METEPKEEEWNAQEGLKIYLERVLSLRPAKNMSNVSFFLFKVGKEILCAIGEDAGVIGDRERYLKYFYGLKLKNLLPEEAKVLDVVLEGVEWIKHDSTLWEWKSDEHKGGISLGLHGDEIYWAFDFAMMDDKEIEAGVDPDPLSRLKLIGIDLKDEIENLKWYVPTRGNQKMNITECFKVLRDAIEWLFDELDINNRENRPTLDELREESLKLNPLESNVQLTRYTVIRMVGRVCGGANFTFHHSEDIEHGLRDLFQVFGGDGPDTGMTRLSDDEYNDNSDLTLSEHLEALNNTAIQFEWLERDSVLMESDLWNNLARSAKIDRPEMSVWITSVNRATKSLRDSCYFEDLKKDRSLGINNELQDIFSVYRIIRPFEVVNEK